MTSREAILAFADRIREEFDPDKVILFGSYARGRQDEESDVDLVVVLPFEGRRVAKALQILSRTRPSFQVDVVVRRPGELERDRSQFDPLARDVLDDGVVLYERAG